MYQGSASSRFSIATVLTAGLLLGSGGAFAQTKPPAMPDAQIEANVLKALAGAPELADQSITSRTIYGTVTLSGTVRDEPTRVLAEHLVAIMLSVGRPKDLARIEMFLSQNAVKIEALEDLIQRHGLAEKWDDYKRKFVG